MVSRAVTPVGDELVERLSSQFLVESGEDLSHAPPPQFPANLVAPGQRRPRVRLCDPWRAVHHVASPLGELNTIGGRADHAGYREQVLDARLRRSPRE